MEGKNQITTVWTKTTRGKHHAKVEIQNSRKKQNRERYTVFFRKTPQGAFEIENQPCHFYPFETLLFPLYFCEMLALTKHNLT